MTFQDWRDADPVEVQGLYAAETRRWEAALYWDPTAALAVLEHGRVAGQVPGWIARDDSGGAAGWTYFVLHDRLLQIGGLVARRPSIARGLIGAILGSPEASVARGWTGFFFPDNDGVASALTRQRFIVRDTLYLERPLNGDPGEIPGAVRSWTEDDFASGVKILAAAYAGDPAAAAFAADGRREQWAQYAWQLLRTPGCGRFDPRLSAIATGAHGGADGVALATWIARDTVHLAQIAVLPEARRRGTGDALVRTVASRALAAGARRLTLMVDGGNQPARRLYARLGFVPRDRLLFATRAARNRVAA